MSWAQWARPILCLAAALCVLGQVSNVTICIDSFSWTINSMGQTPCLVAAFLDSQCGTPTAMDAIPPGTHYLGPDATQQNQCICSSVTYSMVSACGACQGLTYVNWAAWSQSCSLGVELTTYPRTIPPETEVPIWAYLDVTQTNGGFDPVTAQRALIANTTAVPLITSSSSTSQASASTIDFSTNAPTASSFSTSASDSSNGKAHSNAGTIAGGVVGGLVFLATVLLGLLWWIMHRRRNAIQKDLVFDSSALVSGPAVSHTTSSSHPQYGSPPVPISSQSSSGNPAAPVTSGVYTHLRSQRSMESISPSLVHFGQKEHQQQSSSQPRGYGGAPEI